MRLLPRRIVVLLSLWSYCVVTEAAVHRTRGVVASDAHRELPVTAWSANRESTLTYPKETKRLDDCTDAYASEKEGKKQQYGTGGSPSQQKEKRHKHGNKHGYKHGKKEGKKHQKEPKLKLKSKKTTSKKQKSIRVRCDSDSSSTHVGSLGPRPTKPPSAAAQPPPPSKKDSKASEDSKDAAEPTSSSSTQPPPPTQKPTEATVTSQETTKTTASGGKETSCQGAPDADEPDVVTKVLNYQYVILTTPGMTSQRFGEILSEVEDDTHSGLVKELLQCNKFRRRRRLQDFTYTSINSDPQDQVSSEVCEVTPAGTECRLVNGGTTISHLPGGSQDDLLNQVGDSLTTIMEGLGTEDDDVVAVKFVGFADAYGEKATPENGGSDPAGIQTKSSTASANPKKIGGAVAVSLAAVALVVVAALLIRRRHVKGYQQQVNEKGLLLDDEKVNDDSVTYKSEEQTTEGGLTPPRVAVDIVGEHPDDYSDVSSYRSDRAAHNLSYYEGDRTHNPDTCVSITCDICRQAALDRAPIFISPDVNEAILRDLGPTANISVSSADRSYEVPNTVEL